MVNKRNVDDIDNISTEDEEERLAFCTSCQQFQNPCDVCQHCSQPHDLCNCCSNDIQGFAACLEELKHVAKCVFKCIECKPSLHRLQRLQVCILLNEIRNIEGLLTNEIFGLQEIKNEIRFIENELIPINEAVADINDTVNNGNFGLREIKNEIISINEIVVAINATVNNGNVGVFEIKNEIIALNDVVVAINNTVNNGNQGIFEIKNEIISLNNTLQIINNNTQSGFTGSVTTGPILRPSGAANITVKVLNNNATNRTVNINLYNLDTCPKSVVGTQNLTLESCCANAVTFANIPEEYEAQIGGITPGVYVFSTATQGGVQDVIINTLRNSEWSPQQGNGPCNV